MEELESKQNDSSMSLKESWNEDQMRSWKSLEMLRAGNRLKVFDKEIDDVQLRTSRDMESLIQSQPKLDIKSSHRFFDLDQEKERMQRWIEDQERKLKVSPVYSMTRVFSSELNPGTLHDHYPHIPVV